jgi:outer membrane lipoprotein-sorting protein
MQLGSKLVFTALLAVLIVPSMAPATASFAEDKDQVLRQLDAAAANFRSTSADFQFDSVQTDPIPDKDIQQGTVYYERKRNSFQMAAHIRKINGKAVPKIYAYSGGTLKLYEQLIDQVTVFSKANQFESYLMLGFGASGKELENKWDVKYLGSETLSGVKTEKLELVAKDPAVRKTIPKVTLWIDPEHGVSLKQLFDEGQGAYRVCVYFNFKFNQSLPSGAFNIKTDSKTHIVNR